MRNPGRTGSIKLSASEMPFGGFRGEILQIPKIIT